LATGTTKGDMMFHAGSTLGFPLSDQEDEMLSDLAEGTEDEVGIKVEAKSGDSDED